jgi:putative endopeptidase
MTIDRSNFDETVSPGESFYHYVNGNWLKKNAIPSDKSSLNAFVTLDELSKDNLKAIFEGLVREKEGDSLIAELYLSGMNTEAIELAGLNPIKDFLAVIDSIKNVDDVITAVAKSHRESPAQPLFGMYSYTDAKNAGTEALHSSQGGLGLPDRDYYFGDKEKEVAAYKTYLQALFVLSGEQEDEAKTKATKVFEFEKLIAEISLKKQDMRDPLKTYNKLTLAQLKEKCPALNWSLYFSVLEMSNFGDVIVHNIPYYEKLDGLVKFADIETIKSYLKAHLLDGFAPFLSEKFVLAHFEFHNKALQGILELRPRWKRVCDQVSSQLRDEVGKAYVAKHFPESSKAACERMVTYIVKAFEHRIKTVEWMEPETKEKALLKLSKFVPKIGYPSKWIDYESLKEKLSRNIPYAQNLRMTMAANFTREISEANHPTDITKWHMAPFVVNAYFNPPCNEIVFPAAILQPPMYYPITEEFPVGVAALSFGGIGGVIAHEGIDILILVSHAFDDQGRRYDHQGNLNDWWKESDSKQYDERAGKIIKQFDQFQLLGKNINGNMTQGENIADLGGVSIAFAAFQTYLKDNEGQVPVLEGFSPEQQFFVSWAQIWRSTFVFIFRFD